MPTKYRIALALLFIGLAIAARLLPHPGNFTPVIAMLLFAGFQLPRKLIWLPALALVVTDAIIGTYDAGVMAAVYGSYAAVLGLAYALRQRYSFGTAIVSGVAGSTLFFLVTNAAVWLWSGMYEPGVAGLTASYVAGIPFFRNMLLGDVIYTAVFFSIFEAARVMYGRYCLASVRS